MDNIEYHISKQEQQIREKLHYNYNIQRNISSYYNNQEIDPDAEFRITIKSFDSNSNLDKAKMKFFFQNQLKTCEVENVFNPKNLSQTTNKYGGNKNNSFTLNFRI